ncbi:MAG: IS4 family transposase [Deltaproteobacteria bacterium]|nr:IS4 family transposase [Deltaproteobacteria bacterium]
MDQSLIADELAGAILRDRRLTNRLVKLATVVAENPGESFPKIMRTGAELESTYRFLSNDRVTHDDILEAHVQETVKRCSESRTVVVAHDSTEFAYSGHGRKDLGRLSMGEKVGFFGHFALASIPGETREPLGVLGFLHWTRDEKRVTERSEKRHGNLNKESHKWWNLVDAVSKRAECPGSLVHVMDREADSYELLAQMVQAGHRFVIRLRHDRVLDEEGSTSKLYDVLDRAKGVVVREVELGFRKRHRNRLARNSHPPRRARMAKLEFAGTEVTLRASSYIRGDLPKSLRVNVIHVHEVEVPEGLDPVEWRLVTTEPIDTPERILEAVDYYRSRWVIEEFFKALKTGCSIERRQLESLHALLNAVALFVPIAWNMLRLRVLSRNSEETPATTVLTASQIQILRMAPRTTKAMPTEPTAKDAMLAIAALGGHLARNGDPGWITIMRGYSSLLLMEAGWELARNAGRGKNVINLEGRPNPTCNEVRLAEPHCKGACLGGTDLSSEGRDTPRHVPQRAHASWLHRRQAPSVQDDLDRRRQRRERKRWQSIRATGGRRSGRPQAPYRQAGMASGTDRTAHTSMASCHGRLLGPVGWATAGGSPRLGARSAGVRRETRR